MPPWDGSQPPQLLFTPPSDQDQYLQPVWSPDGKYIYFTHVNYQSSSAAYEVMRLAYPKGKPEQLVNQAYWPQISTDGSHLTYVSIFPTTDRVGSSSPILMGPMHRLYRYRARVGRTVLSMRPYSCPMVKRSCSVRRFQRKALPRVG